MSGYNSASLPVSLASGIGGTPAKPEIVFRNIKAIFGIHIQATDGDVGTVVDMIIEEDSWGIQYLVVDAGAWLIGRKIWIPPTWIKHIDWEKSVVRLDASKEEIQKTPQYPSRDPDKVSLKM